MNPETAQVLHLYRRLGFGLLPSEYAAATQQSRSQAIQSLFATHKNKPLIRPQADIPSEEQMKNLSEEQKKELRKQAEQLTLQVNNDWLRQMADPAYALREKMTLFWHGHFACESKLFHLAVQQNNTLRQHALGNFKDLVLAIAKDASMIFYLNNQQNRKKSPNENFARELMELFTIGRGHYTENDVKEAARAFTGWFANRFTGAFEFEEKAHDSGTKVFMNRSGNFDGTDIIDILLQQKQTAKFIAQKVYRFFVNDVIDEARVDFLAQQFFDSNYNIETLMRALANADWFYAAEHIGTKIQSPIELLVQYQKIIGLRFNTPRDAFFLQRMLGQTLFMPPNVAGWPGGKNWIDNATLLFRLNLPSILYLNNDLDVKSKDDPEEAKGKERIKKINAKMDLTPLTKAFEGQSLENLQNYLLRVPFSLKNSPLEKYIQQNSDKTEQIQRATLAFLSLPEFQLH